MELILKVELNLLLSLILPNVPMSIVFAICLYTVPVKKQWKQTLYKCPAFLRNLSFITLHLQFSIADETIS
jgi:branched-subunit amino acid transport protein